MRFQTTRTSDRQPTARAPAARVTPAPPSAHALLALQRTAGNHAVTRALGARSRVLQRVLMSRTQFLAQPVATATIRGAARNDATLQAIADALGDYPNPPPGVSPLVIAQHLSTLCAQWLAANPAGGWVPGAVAPAAAGWNAAPSAHQPAVIPAVRLRIQALQTEVQQELVQLAGKDAHGAGTVFKEMTRTAGSAQTPQGAKQMGSPPPPRDGPARQQHWEGWKIHVSVPDAVAGDIAAAIVPQLEAEGSWYKVRARIDEYRNVTDASVGKFIVIYPRSIEHLEQLLTRLESTLPALTGQRPAPAVTGDVPLDGGGYVWARYGVFLDTVHARSAERWVDLGGRQGESQYSVQDPVVGGWVDDPRHQAIPPAWAAHLLAQIQAIRADRLTRDLRRLERTADAERNRPRAKSF